MMPLWPWWREMKRTMWLSFWRPDDSLTTLSVMLGRSNEVSKMVACSMCSWRRMSSRVRRSAVAVSAITGTSGKRSLTWLRRAYSGLKSWPHCEMQWASSMAMSDTRNCCDQLSMSLSSFSGEM